MKSVVITVDFKRNSSGRTRIYEYAPPPPINALVSALHGLRTVNSISPLAIWYSEVETGIDNFDIGNISLYGIDPDGPIVNDIETENMVIVPESTITLTEMQMNDVTNLLPNPLVDDGNHKINHYLQIQNYLRTEYQ